MVERGTGGGGGGTLILFGSPRLHLTPSIKKVEKRGACAATKSIGDKERRRQRKGAFDVEIKKQVKNRLIENEEKGADARRERDGRGRGGGGEIRRTRSPSLSLGFVAFRCERPPTTSVTR